ncbi:MAG: cytochrome c [Gammaproteobacteria bacterium]|nr:cytochrome c [Gammaproteobacteria bacterium]
MPPGTDCPASVGRGREGGIVQPGRVIGIAAVAVLTAALGSAAHADGATLYVQKTCATCHGKDGRSPLLPEYPKIAGQNARYAERQMLDIKEGARANGDSASMQGVMVPVSEADIRELADYLASLPP